MRLKKHKNLTESSWLRLVKCKNTLIVLASRTHRESSPSFRAVSGTRGSLPRTGSTHPENLRKMRHPRKMLHLPLKTVLLTFGQHYQTTIVLMVPMVPMDEGGHEEVHLEDEVGAEVGAQLPLVHTTIAKRSLPRSLPCLCGLQNLSQNLSRRSFQLHPQKRVHQSLPRNHGGPKSHHGGPMKHHGDRSNKHQELSPYFLYNHIPRFIRYQSTQ